MSRLVIIFSLLGLIAGVATGLLVRPSLALIAPLSCLFIVAWSIHRARWTAMLVLLFIFGWLRCSSVTWPGQRDVVRYVGQRVTMIGSITLPGQNRDGMQTVILTKLTMHDEPQIGSVQVRLPAIPHIVAGSRQEVTCLLEALTGSWRRQWSQGVHARCTATSSSTRISQDGYWRSQLGRAQERVMGYVRQHFREPQASLLNGILIGNTDGMPSVQQQAFQATGTTHIVALSGFNVTIIITVIMSWLGVIIGRRWAWMPALLLVLLFIVMSGASASVVRAGCMTAIAQLALALGRPVRIWRLVAYAAILMILANPLIAVCDLGFQLSFLSTIGLIGLSVPLTTILRRWLPASGWVENLATTLSAMLMTEPLLLWRFGRLSLIAPLVNMAVLPLIPMTMAVGACSLLGMAWPPLGWLAGPITDALLRVVLWLITWGARVPHAWTFVSPVVGIAIAIGCIIISTILLRRHETLSGDR